MFGLLLWLAAVAGTVVLHKNFARNGVDADALNVVALVVVAGVIGAKVWHELQNIRELQLRAAHHRPAGMASSAGCRDAFPAVVPRRLCLVRRHGWRALLC